MSSRNVARLRGVGILIFVIILMATSGTYMVPPGYRGVEVTMGRVTPVPKAGGFGFKIPMVTHVELVSVRQETHEDEAQCYSSDLQQIHIELRVLYAIPEGSVVKLYQTYDGDPYESLVAPRVHEALKEVAALQSAEQIVKAREQIKSKALALAQDKVGGLILLKDIVIQNIRLTKELEHAIEAKMVQEQEAQRSKYLQQRAQIDADTSVIKARGEAESIRSRGEALRENPAYLDLQIVDRWDGIAPLIIGGRDQFVLPLNDLEKLKQNGLQVPQRGGRNAP